MLTSWCLTTGLPSSTGSRRDGRPRISQRPWRRSDLLHTRTDRVPPAARRKAAGKRAVLLYDVGHPRPGTGNVRLCIDATGMSFVDSSPAAVSRLNGSVWTDIDATLPAESTNHLNCGAVPFGQTLGTFALFTRSGSDDACDDDRRKRRAATGGQHAAGGSRPGTSHRRIARLSAGAGARPGQPVSVLSDTNRIRRIDLQNNVMTTIASIPIFGQVAVDRAGNVFLTDVNGCGVLRLAPQNDFTSYALTRVAGTGFDPARGGLGIRRPRPCVSADISDLNGKLAFDASGNLFIGQQLLDGSGTYAIRRITPGDDGVIRATIRRK